MNLRVPTAGEIRIAAAQSVTDELKDAGIVSTGPREYFRAIATATPRPLMSSWTSRGRQSFLALARTGRPTLSTTSRLVSSRVRRGRTSHSASLGSVPRLSRTTRPM
eukprot:7035946-Prymnesium_polylepis.1